MIEEALKRLDQPRQTPPEANFEVTVHVLLGTNSSIPKETFPPSIEPVLAQLRNTLKFANYQFVTTFVNRVKNNGAIEIDGIAPAPLALYNDAPSQTNASSITPKTFLRFRSQRVSQVSELQGKETVAFDRVSFGMQVPVVLGNPGQIQYKDIGLNTSLSLREGETVVIGTNSIGENAVIILVSVKKR